MIQENNKEQYFLIDDPWIPIDIDVDDHPGGGGGGGGSSTVTKYSSVNGTVKDNNGTLLADIVVILQPNSSEYSALGAETNANGYFSFPSGDVENISSGTLTFSDTSLQYNYTTASFGTDISTRTGKIIVMNKTVTNIGDVTESEIKEHIYKFAFTNSEIGNNISINSSDILSKVANHELINVVGKEGYLTLGNSNADDYYLIIDGNTLVFKIPIYSKVKFTFDTYFTGVKFKEYTYNIEDATLTSDSTSNINYVTLVKEPIIINVSFNITDSETNEVLNDANITITDFETGEIKSCKGNESLTCTPGSNVIIYCVGYTPNSANIPISQLGNYTVNVALDKIPEVEEPEQEGSASDWHKAITFGIPWYKTQVDLQYTARNTESPEKLKFTELKVNIGNDDNISCVSENGEQRQIWIDNAPTSELRDVNKIYLKRSQEIQNDIYTFSFYVYKECYPAYMITKSDKYNVLSLHTYKPTDIQIKHRIGDKQYKNYTQSTGESADDKFKNSCLITSDTEGILNGIKASEVSYPDGGPVNVISLVSNTGTHTKFDNVQISPLVSEITTNYLSKLSALYNVIDCHHESYSFTSNANAIEFIYNYEYPSISVGPFEYKFKQDDEEEYAVQLQDVKFNDLMPNINIKSVDNMEDVSYGFNINNITIGRTNNRTFKFTDSNDNTSMNISYTVGNSENTETISISYSVVANPTLTLNGYKFKITSGDTVSYELSSDETRSMQGDYSLQTNSSTFTSGDIHIVCKQDGDRQANDIKFNKQNSNPKVQIDENRLLISSSYSLQSDIKDSNAAYNIIASLNGGNTWINNVSSINDNQSINIIGSYVVNEHKEPLTWISYSYTYEYVDIDDVVVTYNTNNGEKLVNLYNDTTPLILYNNDRVSTKEYSNRWKLDSNVQISNKSIEATNYSINNSAPNNVLIGLKKYFTIDEFYTYLCTDVSENKIIFTYYENENHTDLLNVDNYVRNARDYVLAKTGHDYIFEDVDPYGANTTFFNSKIHDADYLGLKLKKSENKYMITTENPGDQQYERNINDYINILSRKKAEINLTENYEYDYSSLLDEQVINSNYITYYYNVFDTARTNANNDFSANSFDASFSYGNVRSMFIGEDLKYFNSFIAQYESIKMNSNPDDLNSLPEYSNEYKIYYNSQNTYSYNGLKNYLLAYSYDPTWQEQASYSFAWSYVLGFTYSYAYENIPKYSNNDIFYKLGTIEIPDDLKLYYYDLEGDRRVKKNNNKEYGGQDGVINDNAHFAQQGETFIKDNLSMYKNYVNNVTNLIQTVFVKNDSNRTSLETADIYKVSGSDTTPIFGNDSTNRSISFDRVRNGDINKFKTTKEDIWDDYKTLNEKLDEYDLTLKDYNLSADMYSYTQWADAFASCNTYFIPLLQNVKYDLETVSASQSGEAAQAYKNLYGDNGGQQCKQAIINNLYNFIYKDGNDHIGPIVYIKPVEAARWADTTNDFNDFCDGVQLGNISLSTYNITASEWNPTHDDEAHTQYSGQELTDARRAVYGTKVVGEIKTAAQAEKFIYLENGTNEREFATNSNFWEYSSIYGERWNKRIYYYSSTDTEFYEGQIANFIDGGENLFNLLYNYALLIAEITPTTVDGVECYVIDKDHYNAGLYSSINNIIPGFNKNNNTKLYFPKAAIESFRTYLVYYNECRYVNVSEDYSAFINKVLESNSFNNAKIIQNFGQQCYLNIKKCINTFNDYLTKIKTYLNNCNINQYLDDLAASETEYYSIDVDILSFEILINSGINTLAEIAIILNDLNNKGIKLMIRKHLQRALLYNINRLGSSATSDAIEANKKIFTTDAIIKEIKAVQEWLKYYILNKYKNDEIGIIGLQYGNNRINYKPIGNVLNNVRINKLLCNGYNIYSLNSDLYNNEVHPSEYNIRYVINDKPEAFTNSDNIYAEKVHKFNGTIYATFDELSGISNSDNVYLHILVYYDDSFVKEVTIYNNKIQLANKIFNTEIHAQIQRNKMIISFDEINEEFIDQTKYYFPHIELNYKNVTDGGEFTTVNIYNNGGYKFDELSLTENENKLFLFAWRVVFKNINNDETLYSEYNYLPYFMAEENKYKYTDILYTDGTWNSTSHFATINNKPILSCTLYVRNNFNNGYWWYVDKIYSNSIVMKLAKSFTIDGVENTPEITPNYISDYDNHELIIVTAEDNKKYELI